MRIGIDLGGTKTEIIALDENDGVELYRKRISTPRAGYASVIASLKEMVEEAEAALGKKGTVGIGIPGTVVTATGRVKNANLQVLNGEAFEADMAAALSREVRTCNDANCLAVSEAVDGAAAGKRVVFAAILGTGCGGGVALDGKAWAGPNAVAGEWGHNPLPWMRADEYPGPDCWCGKQGCLELFISGTGFTLDYERATGAALTGAEIIEKMQGGEQAAADCFERYAQRLSRALAGIVNVLDPDVIVLGGGMSNVDALYARVPKIMPNYVFGGAAETPVLKNKHGDSSGVRGAAWLFE